MPEDVFEARALEYPSESLVARDLDDELSLRELASEYLEARQFKEDDLAVREILDRLYAVRDLYTSDLEVRAYPEVSFFRPDWAYQI